MKMTYITKIFIRVFLLTVSYVPKDLAKYEKFKTFETIFDFTVELRNDSDDIVDYATTIQALFCPELPLCNDEGFPNRTDLMGTLPEILRIGAENQRIEDVHKIVGACCLPCSCDTSTCKEDGNCCLSKVAMDTLRENPDADDRNSIDVLGRVNSASDLNNDNTTAVYSECIKASWLSYRDKDAVETANDLAIPSYFMITQCFENKTNDLDVENCQSPPDDDGKLMLPVTSLVTGRTYWNSHCARCNNDENDLLPWIPTAKFNIDISYFLNRSQYQGSVYPETYNDVLRFIAETGNIIYTPPIPNEKKLCMRRNTFFTCKQPRRRNTDAAWLEKACERVYSPVIIEDYIGRRFPFLNIFCYLLLCRNQYMHTNLNRKEKAQCSGVEDSGKGSLGGLTALLDYTAEENNDNTRTTETRQDKCHCDELYDVYLHICRRVYCPMGDFMINCHCVQPLKMVYGMPVLLIAKLIPKSGDPITIEKKQISKFHKALASIMHSITENVFVKFIGLFECRADPKNYYLSLIVVRSFPGHDSKETIKSFLGYLDNTKMVDMNIGRTTYSVRLTSRIRLWNEATKLHDDFNFADLETKVHNHTILFSTNHLYKVYDQSFQILSPLLYCRQIQLNDSEFVEEDEQLTTFLTPKNITLMYYIRVSPSEVRVCADHYMGTSHHNAGNNVRHSVISMYTRVLFLFICGIFHVC